MKTAISIPNAVFEAAEQLAERIGISRSELYSNAVAEYMERHRAAGVRERLDAVYELQDEAARLKSVMSIVDAGPVRMEDWL